MLGHPNATEETVNAVSEDEEEGTDPAIEEDGTGKIPLEVSVSKQNPRERGMAQIIREILDLDCPDVEVKKVAMPAGEGPRQVQNSNNHIEQSSSSVEFLATDSAELLKKRRRRPQRSSTKLMKYNKLYKVKVPKSLSRTRQCSRSRGSETPSENCALNTVDVSEVHSSPAITNLLSQLYPNPYKLITLMEVENNAKRSLSREAAAESKGCDVTFKAGNNSCSTCAWGCYAEQDVTSVKSFKSFVVMSMGTAPENGVDGSQKCESKPQVGAAVFGRESNPENPAHLSSSSGLGGLKDETAARAPCRRVKRMATTFSHSPASSAENCASKLVQEEESAEGRTLEKPRTGSANEEGSTSEIPQKFKMTGVEFKMSKKPQSKSCFPTAEKVEGNKTCERRRTLAKEPSASTRKVPTNSVHSRPLHKAVTRLGEGKGPGQISKPPSDSPGRVFPSGKHPGKTSEARDGGREMEREVERKKSGVMHYLQFIKEVYEAKERELQSKIEEALNFALSQIDNLEKTGGQTQPCRQGTSCQTPGRAEVKLKNSQSQTPRMSMCHGRCKRHAERRRIDGRGKSAAPAGTTTGKVANPVTADSQVQSERGPEAKLHLATTNRDLVQASCSSSDHSRNYQLNLVSRMHPGGKAENGKCGNVNGVVRADAYFFSGGRMNRRSMSEGIPIDVINMNVEETNRKIDLLIRHIDNSMNWLSQSQKTDSSSISSLIETARDLSVKLERNLRNCRGRFLAFPKDGHSKDSLCNRSKLMFEQTYQSLRIFPKDNPIGSIRISADALLNRDLLSFPNRNYLWLHSDMLRPSLLGNVMNDRGRWLTLNCGTGQERASDEARPRGPPTRADAADAENSTGQRDDERARNRRAGNRNFATLESEVPELPLAPARVPLVSVESSNELGSFIESVDCRECGSRRSSESLRRRKWDSKVSLADVKTALDTEERLLKVSSERNICSVAVKKRSPTSLSISVVAFNEDASITKPVIVQEITWNFHLPVPAPAVRVHFRNERSFVYTTMEASVLHVAVPTCFLDLSLVSLIRVVEHEPKQHTSTIISLHKCSSFVTSNDGPDESSKVCKFVVLPAAANFAQCSSGNLALSDEESASVDIKVLKKPESTALPCRIDNLSSWGFFLTESSENLCEADKLEASKMGTVLQRRSQTQSRATSQNFEWIRPLPVPYESNAAQDIDRVGVTTPVNFHTVMSRRIRPPARNEDPFGTAMREDLYPNSSTWDRRRAKFDEVAPLIVRYLSSDTSNTSVDSDTEHRNKKNKNLSDLANLGGSLFRGSSMSPNNETHWGEEQTRAAPEPQENGSETKAVDEPVVHPPEYDDGNDSSSTSSFKSSNDYSDLNEASELKLPDKMGKSRTHFLERLFRELRSFRKFLSKKRCLKKRTRPDDKKAPNEFEDALSVLVTNAEQEKAAESEQKQKVDEAIAANTKCLDELTIPAGQSMPRKIFKTSFRGKESLTELMIDLKDVSISEVSDISVEKMKLSTDHTKISIIISKHTSEDACRKICCTNQSSSGTHGDDAGNKTQGGLPPEGFSLGWKKEGKGEGDDDDDDDDDEDYKSVDSSIHSKSTESLSKDGAEDDFTALHEDLNEPKWRSKSYRNHRFDFYKKTEKATSSFDTLKVDGKEIFFSSKYDRTLEPLKKALTDMQLRVRNIQRNSFCSSDNYYERALRMAKMSAGYCQSCQNKTVIPEDPLGFYQKLVPRARIRSPYAKQRKYYFRTTSSTNSSFYSIHSSNSDLSDGFCHLNSSSSIVTNGLTRSRGSALGESKNAPLPVFLGRNIHL